MEWVVFVLVLIMAVVAGYFSYRNDTKECAKKDERLASISTSIIALQERVEALESAERAAEEATEEEARKAKELEKLWNDGVASILSYNIGKAASDGDK